MNPVTASSVDRLVRALSRLRTRARVLLVVRELSVLLAAVVVGALVLGLLDYGLRLPSTVRWIALLGGLVLAGAWVVRRVIPAARFCPRLTDVALRVEESNPEVRGLLASALDFSESASRGEEESALARALERGVIDRAMSGWRDDLSDRLLMPAPTMKKVGVLVVALAAALAPLAVSASMWGIGATRVLSPWVDASWPKRTGVADVTGVRVHPLGRALPMRAALTKSSRSPESTDVFLRYRLTEGGASGSYRRELLTLQNRTVADGTGAESPLFERLLEPSADEIEYRFETEDDRTAWTRIRLVEPPSIVGADALIESPAYVAGDGGVEARSVEMGPGTDDRAIAPSTLVGSTVTVEIRLNKPARLVGEEGPAPSVLDLIDPEKATLVEANTEPSRIRARFVLHDTLRLPISLLDEHGIGSVDEAVYIFGATADREAGATITQPQADLGVLATALVDVTGEGRDDVGLEWVSVERRTMTPAGGEGGEPSGPGGALEPSGPAVEMARSEVGGEAATAVATAGLDLSELGVSPGDEVHLTALAMDVYAVDGVGRAPSRSPVRVLRIISREEFVEDIQSQLSDVRQAAIRIEAQQGEVQTGTRDAGATTANRRGQSQVSERIDRQVEMLEEIGERAARNRLEDEGLAELLEEVEETLSRAGRSASSAGGAMDRAAAEAGERGEEAAPEAGEEVSRDQQRTRDELSQVIRLLDAGQDSWVVRNSLQRILDEQRDLRERAASLGRRTAGREMSDLTDAERREAEGLAEDQQQLAEELDELVEEMEEREEALRESDPMSAAGMSAASQRAQREGTSQTMREASQSASENQMSNAGQQQEQAEESLEEMLEDLEAGERRRDEVLRRLLMSVIESIDVLIARQEGEIAALDAAVEAGAALGPLDAGMIELNRNTLGVADQAREGGVELAQVADLLRRAAGFQEDAVTALRQVEVDAGEVRDAEDQSLRDLLEAKRMAEALEQRMDQQEMDRRKRELRKAYREALERQVALRERTGAFVALEDLSRRDRIRVRQQADEQEEIRAALQEIEKGTAEFAQARVYAHAHARLESYASGAVASLGEGDPGRAMARQDGVIHTLTSIIESLRDPKPDPSEFSEAQSDAGGGSGGAQQQQDQLVSMLGELTLLRSIQEFVADETASLDEVAIDEGALESLAGEQRDLAKVAEDLVSRLRGGGGTMPPPSEDDAETGEDAEEGEGAEGGEGEDEPGEDTEGDAG